jgi:aminopeptidase N
MAWMRASALIPKVLCLAASLAFITACDNVERNATTLDTGLPMSEGLQAYDVQRYTLRHDILIEKKAIAGSATVQFKALKEMDVLELDFDGAFHIEKIEGSQGLLDYEQSDSKLFVTLGETAAPDDVVEVTVVYRGKPLEATRAPWDGGFVWSETPDGKPWIATTFQGEGCDIWWPCKDHPSDEPDGLDLHITVPHGLIAAANGVLVDVSSEDNGRQTFHWQTNVPTNLYGVALNIGPYVLIDGSYLSTNGTEIPLAFFAIEEHQTEARQLFETELPEFIEFFERVVGPYPWGQEKLGLAETPYLGMEHQTINAYGNEFKRDKYGFDWLLHHELSHEWFGNLVSAKNYADLWIHEGFAAYVQPVYTQELMGDAAFHARMYEAYLRINACNPLAPRAEMSDDQMYGDEGPGGDIYVKGAWVLHSLRYLMEDDAFWESVRILAYGTPHPETLEPPIVPRHRTTDEYLEIAGTVAGRDLTWFFEVYFRTAAVPELTSRQDGADVLLEWSTEGDLPFDMPVPVRRNGEVVRVDFSGNSARLEKISLDDVQIDPFMQVLRKLPSLPTCEERKAEEEEES